MVPTSEPFSLASVWLNKIFIFIEMWLGLVGWWGGVGWVGLVVFRAGPGKVGQGGGGWGGVSWGGGGVGVQRLVQGTTGKCMMWLWLVDEKKSPFALPWFE